MKIKEKIHNLITDDTEVIERDASPSEIDAHNKLLAELNEQRQIQQEKRAAKQIVLEKLGLTAEEAAVLLS